MMRSRPVFVCACVCSRARAHLRADLFKKFKVAFEIESDSDQMGSERARAHTREVDKGR